MPKKRVKRQKRSPNFALRIALITFSALLFAIGLTVFLNIPSQNFCANSISCINNLTGQKETTNKGVFLGKNVTAPDLPEDNPAFAIADMKAVLGDATGGTKHIYVDLTNQRLLAYDGNTLVYNFQISSGKWNPTPTGDFRIWIWLRYTRMTGGNKAKGDYYDLPNVPYTMYFYNDVTPKIWGYSLHGAYWHNNFGHPMSHGCVNMRIADAQTMFYWTNPTAGTISYASDTVQGPIITIYGTTPAN
jgi:hypothetical protein